MADTGYKISITVTYDNNPSEQELETDWGFSAFITGIDPQPRLAPVSAFAESTGAGAWKSILFDTGGQLLLDNMEKLAIEPANVDVVVLSHIHRDHTGGLDSFLEKNPNVTVYLPSVFPKKFKDNARNHGARIIEVKESEQICENVYSTGQLGRLIKEQSLIIRTDKGLVVIIGCAHPGIVNIINTVKDLMDDDIFLVMGNQRQDRKNHIDF
jgi:7,8-dihydropterin-6-yl-methyl-4-(beta-D-ribofuranosyl)aminobenzene 5'-phosphate synthase